MRNYKNVNLWHVVFPLIFLGVFSYPFLSQDFFNYLFDAKIATFYFKNPYLHKALDFPGDPWLRFTQWTHRTYPYGPAFLLISLVPSFLSFGKFLLAFLFFKATSALFYVSGVYYLSKLDKKWAVIFATNPLVLTEGLVSSHNDLIGVSLAIVGIYYLFAKRNILGRVFLLLSAGIKYITLPLVFLSKTIKQYNHIAIFGLCAILAYLSFFSEIQPWYFLALFAALPFYEKFISKLNIFFAGLLFSYYPYVRFGGWDKAWKIALKHQIIIAFVVLNAVILLFKFFYKVVLNKVKLRFPGGVA
ncbi:hypothetical protein HYT33_02755 [Candidatus Roizmanbacteria bacterium]|nr:hypothetical protein [Candidatus Roizmanbacteria bacterium]